MPDHPTLWRFGRRHPNPDVTAAAPGETVARVTGRLRGPRLVAPDSTGLRLPHASRRFERRAGRGRGRRGRLERAPASRTGPQLLVARRVRPGPAGDLGDPVPPAGAAHAVLPSGRPVADAGHDSEADRRLRREDLGVDGLIPAEERRPVRVAAATPHRREVVRRLGEPGGEEARRACRQRWKAGTVMSVAERRRGEAPSARLDETQAARALPRGVVHDPNRLVRLDHAPRTSRQGNAP